MAIIVLDGIDGSGKSTQYEKLCACFAAHGLPYRSLTFPNYGHPSCTLVDLYLSGALGEHPSDINAYASSSFYACDRFVSYQQDWSKDYHAGKTLLMARYSTSNLTHQMVKLPKDQWDEFIRWSMDYEHVRLGLPTPDLVIFLDMQPETSRRLLSHRYQGDESKRDLHEADFAYLMACRTSGLYAAEKLGWQVISCCDGLEPYPIETIFQQVKECVNLSHLIPERL